MCSFVRGLVVVIVAIVLAVAVSSATARETALAAKPNIVFIMADDLGREWISCYGGGEMKTPHIDALAKTGLRFTNAYSMPKCTPTRVTLLTGQYPFRHGWTAHWDVPRWGAGVNFDWKHNVSFARVMKSAGYTTAIAGKWQINDFRVQPEALQKHGFDEHCMWTGYETGITASGKRYWDPYVRIGDESKTHRGKFGPDVYADFLIDFMKRKKDVPFLAYFPMALPHGPLVATPLRPEAKGRDERFKAMVEYVDHLVGRIVKSLDETGIRRKTIVIFTTDNGTSGGMTARLGGVRVRGGKDKFTDAGAHAPFIVNCPGLVPAGKVIDDLVDFTDMLPTFAELGGAKLPRGVTLDGFSIASTILGRKHDGPKRQWVLAMGPGTMTLKNGRLASREIPAPRTIRDRRYKLWRSGGKSTRLVDLLADPHEKKDLLGSADPSAIAARKRLESILTSLPPDAPARYEKTPPQPWDRKAGAGGRKARKRKKNQL